MPQRILVVRLGAMGDVIHALPAVATLHRSFPQSEISWIVEPRWAPLLAENPHIREAITLDRRQWQSILSAWKRLRRPPFDWAIDLQGLIKSALTARASGALRITGYNAYQVRERPAALLYTEAFIVQATHVIDRHRELVHAAGATLQSTEFTLPKGAPEGELPDGPFILACPLAGWRSKEWPLPAWSQLAAILKERFGLPLVLNGHPAAARQLAAIDGVQVHISSIPGLINATRRAKAIIGLDSGPLHLAAALQKRGVAIFGPTDPARNGPYGGTIQVLRSPNAQTSYKREQNTDPNVAAITPAMVAQALENHL